MRVLMLAALLPGLLGLAAASKAEPGVLEIAISGVRSAQGHVLVAVCGRDKFLAESCPYRGRTVSKPGTVTIRIEGIPPGIYAAQAFQDENDNNKLDRTLLGMPKEGLGFSNDAKMRFGPPSFDDAAFQLTAGGGVIRFSLRYYD